MRDPIEEASGELYALADLCAERYLGGPAIVLRLYADDDIRRLGLRSVTNSLARCVINASGEARAAYQMAYDAIAAIEARVLRERAELDVMLRWQCGERWRRAAVMREIARRDGKPLPTSE